MKANELQTRSVNKSQTKKLEKGFTLVELLIVVSIIGILTTIGIPSYKKMVQKSKKSEAKIALGALFTAEAAFFSEYGAYGSQIEKIGFEQDGGTHRYSTGFPTAACAQLADKPVVTTSIGAQIQSSFPAYYSTDPNTTLRSVYLVAGAAACEVGVVPDDGSTFLATSSGVIKPGVPSSAAIDEQDVWTMNENRELKNIRDGVE